MSKPPRDRMLDRIHRRREAIYDHCWFALDAARRVEDITPRERRKIEELCRDHRQVLIAWNVTATEALQHALNCGGDDMEKSRWFLRLLTDGLADPDHTFNWLREEAA